MHTTHSHTHDLDCTNTSRPEQRRQAFERAEQRRAAEAGHATLI